MTSKTYYIESSSLQQGGGRTKVEPDKTKLIVWGDLGAKRHRKWHSWTERKLQRFIERPLKYSAENVQCIALGNYTRLKRAPT